MNRFRFAQCAGMTLAGLSLALLLACGSKHAPTAPSGTEGNQPPAGTSPWTPEPSSSNLHVESSADAFNRQGVLKRIHFDTNRWEILPEGRKILKENAAWILAHPQFRVAIEGNCDERNTEAYNLALGERRANAAKEYLVG